MQPPNGSHREGFQNVTLPEASRLLGVSESTVRRMVKAGKLEATRVERSQGHLWLIRLPAPSSQGQDARQTVSAVEGSNPPAPDAMMAASRLANEQKAETIGRLTAELDALRAQNATLDASGSTPTPDPPTEASSPFPEP